MNSSCRHQVICDVIDTNDVIIYHSLSLFIANQMTTFNISYCYTVNILPFAAKMLIVAQV